ncbi:hypothetical protein LCGC14_1365740 [marine sediment metagenome]|uniref:Uncharacterized protein n=1 Tax=marine sediment metagenome TaxID=412755 RepID=A0A0F9K6V8_9ZZZZ
MDSKSKQETSANEDQPKVIEQLGCKTCGGTGKLYIPLPHTCIGHTPGIRCRICENSEPCPCPDCQKSPASDIATILQEADKALLAGKYVVAHSYLRLAITELTQ